MIFFKKLSFIQSWQSGVLSLLLGVFLITGCSKIKRGTRQKLYSRQKQGRQDGSGVPDKMLSKVMTSAKSPNGIQSQGVRVFNVPYNQVFGAVRKTLTFKEYPILKRDIKRGIIESGYRPHDGLFTQGFLGGKMRSKMVAKLTELGPKKTEVILWIIVEKEEKDGTWQHFPIRDYDLDLIDSDSIEIYFYNILKRLNSQATSKG